MQSITPFLWFDNQAEEAANFYVSLFDNSKIISVERLPDVEEGPVNEVVTLTFQLDGQEFMAINAGPQFKFTEAVSFYVHCETQEKVDFLWEKLTEGGEEQPCGWLKDKYGLSWQIVPTVLGELLNGTDRARAQRVMQAMFQMTKLDIQRLQEA